MICKVAFYYWFYPKIWFCKAVNILNMTQALIFNYNTYRQHTKPYPPSHPANVLKRIVSWYAAVLCSVLVCRRLRLESRKRGGGAPFTFSLVQLTPPFPVWKYSLYRQCVAGRGLGCWLLLETIFCRSLTLCIWPDSEAIKLRDCPKQKPRRGGGLRQI